MNLLRFMILNTKCIWIVHEDEDSYHEEPFVTCKFCGEDITNLVYGDTSVQEIYIRGEILLNAETAGKAGSSVLCTTTGVHPTRV